MTALEDAWDGWLGQLALRGVDPRTWDLRQLLSAFEAAMQRSAEDEASWKRTRAAFYQEPPAVRQARQEALRKVPDGPAQPSRVAMSGGDLSALLAAVAQEDAALGLTG